MKKLPATPRNKPFIIVIAIIAFTLIGMMSNCYPEILGNGKEANQLSFGIGLTTDYALGLFVCKCLGLILASVAGAYGGRITPSRILGSLIAFVLASLWNFDLPYISMATAAIIGATVFLGLTFSMSITATVFLLELTYFNPSLLYPICSCFLTALSV